MRLKTLIYVVAAFISITSFAGRGNELTLLIVPREDGALRAGLDIASRYPTLLLSYQLRAGGNVSLHGWTGSEWVGVELDAYTEGNFFRQGPDSALLVERQGSPVPENLVPSEQWCGSVYKISSTEIRPMLHLAGQYYDFKFKDWQWFSENYHLPLEAINPEGLNVAWYHRRLSDHLKNKPAAEYDDLQYWVVLREPEPEVPEEQDEAAVETNEVPVLMVETNAPLENPLTNEVPAAVIMTAADSEETTVTETNAVPQVSTEPEP